jgi:hypothetical protein
VPGAGDLDHRRADVDAQAVRGFDCCENVADTASDFEDAPTGGYVESQDLLDELVVEAIAPTPPLFDCCETVEKRSQSAVLRDDRLALEAARHDERDRTERIGSR